MYQSLTAESKFKGDEGIYAAIDAARLAQALRGATLSRLSARDRTAMATILSASGSAGGDLSGKGGPQLGDPPKMFQATNATESVRARVREEALQDPELNHEAQVAVGIPDSINSPAFRALLPHLKKIRPGKPLTYDELQKVLIMVAAVVEDHYRDSAKTAASGATTLDLAGCAVPSTCVGGSDSAAASKGTGGGDSNGEDSEGDGPAASGKANAEEQISIQALEKVLSQLQERYPLPVPKEKAAKGSEDSAEEEEKEEDEEDEESAEALKHNAELRARCELLQIPYSDYRTALHDMALYETEIFPLICQFLATDRKIKVALMDHNKLGAVSRKVEGAVDLRALRALAAMIDANEHLKVLDLSHNELGPNGVGIVAKALTKNICLQEVDLSENKLNAEPLEELEDPEFAEEDPVFGERYSGLEAISEVLKKNKFLRVLRLGGNGIHSGEDLTAPAEEDNGGVEEEEAAAGGGVAAPTPEDIVAGWAEVPLWKLVQPLQNFHRLTVLDLRGNQLGVQGTRMLATALSTNHSVRALDLTDNGIGYRGLHYLSTLVLASPTSVLETLVLQRNDLAGKSRNPSTQKKLRLKPKKAALAAMNAFAEAMCDNRKVRRLVLSENHLGPILSAAMLASISRAEVLEELDFSWNEACGDHESLLDLTAVSSLAAALYPSVISRPSASAADGEERLPHQPTLARVYLSGNNLCAAGLAALFPCGGLTPQYSLEELDLSRNYIGDALEPLSHLLRVSPTVLRVNLAYNNISSVGAMLDGLRANASIASIDLSHNKLGSLGEQRHLPEDFGGATFCVTGSLKNPAALQAAAMQAINHNDPGACAAQREEVAQLWQTLAAHTALVEVNLSWNNLREEHALDLIEAFAVPCASAALAKVDISNNPLIPTTVVKTLLDTFAPLPGMRVVYTSIPNCGSPQQSLEGAADATAAEKDQHVAQAAILSTITDAVANSGSLLDLSCWGLSFGGDNATETVESLRRKLLLNAMLAAST